jgi:hypothetical protein
MALLQSGTRIYGNTTIDTFLTVGANANILSTTTSTSNTTGALTVSGGVGIAGNLYCGSVVVNAGTTTIAPLTFASGANLITQTAGSVEYDGVRFYGTTDTTGGRGYIQTAQYLRLDANTPTALAITPAKYFGGVSQFNLAAASTYEIEAFLYFTKTTAGTVTISLNQTQAPQFINGTITYGASGGQASQAMSTINIFANPNANAAFSASNTLTTAVNHTFKLNAIVGTNATNASIANVTIWQSAGTVTPLRGSYLKITRLPTTSNTGNFVA